MKEVVGEQVPIDRYYTLRDKIVDKWNMHKAAKEVIKNVGSVGIDGVSIAEFNEKYKFNMQELHRQLKNGNYQPSPVLRVYILKSDGSERPLGIPTVKDRNSSEFSKRSNRAYI